MDDKENQIGVEVLSLASTPTWSVATVLTVFIVLSLIFDRCVHRLSDWLPETNRKPLLAAVQKMKDEMMLLGLISLLLTATSASIPNICIPSKFQSSIFAPCPKFEHDDGEIVGKNISEGWKPFSRRLNELDRNTCKVGYVPFISSEGIEELHRFIFVMAVTHVSYCCLAMLLAFVKLRSWRAWEDEAHVDRDDALTEIARETTVRRQTTFVRYHASIPVARNRLLIWVTCFLRQFAPSVVRADYFTLREAFITKHNLSSRFDFYSYMIRSLEEEFQRIVGVSGPLWGFVVAFMLFNVNGSNLYFWIAVISVTLVLLVGTKLQHVIATLTLGNAGIAGFFVGPRDELFWFNRPALLLSLMHFILFQNAFELALLFWSLWHRQLGFGVCFFHNNLWLYSRLTLGFVGQSLFIYSTLPLYALVNQMGTNHKAALIPQWIRETIHGWKKTAERRRHGHRTGDSAIHRDDIELQMMSLEEDEHQSIDIADNVTELQPPNVTCPSPVTDGTSSMVAIMSSSVPPVVNVDEDDLELEGEEKHGDLELEGEKKHGDEEARHQTCMDIGKFFLENGIAFSVASSPSFINMCRSIGSSGCGLEPPTPNEIDIDQNPDMYRSTGSSGCGLEPPTPNEHDTDQNPASNDEIDEDRSTSEIEEETDDESEEEIDGEQSASGSNEETDGEQSSFESDQETGDEQSASESHEVIDDEQSSLSEANSSSSVSSSFSEADYHSWPPSDEELDDQQSTSNSDEEIDDQQSASKSESDDGGASPTNSS